MTMTLNTSSSPSSSSPKNHTEVDYGSIPATDSVKKATILDEMDPLVRDRIKAQKQKKLGVAAMVTLLIVVVVAVSMTIFAHKDKQEDAKAILDNRFASLLVDDQAFFFPTATSPKSRRSLVASDAGDATASSENPWALAWADNKDSFAAVGAYYHAKGKAIAHYYKSLYDPLYNKTAEEAGVANVTLTETTAAPWTFDWKKDSPAAIAMSQKYKAIGDAIEDHYKQAFDPSTSLPSESTSDAGTRRHLRGLKETSDNDDASAAAPAYDWAADRDRGIAIGEHFKELGQQIKEHYEKAFGELANSDAAAPVDWAATWTDLKAKGEAIGTYYHDKGVAIGRFYEQQWEAANNSANLLSRKVSLWHSRSASIVAAVPASTDTDDATATTAKNDWYIWGMDWQNGKEQAMNLHEEMKAKGQAIAAYYRAKFDPTFMANAAELISNPLDNLSFPSWGEDAEADKAHGKAIGEYWATHGKQVGKKQKDLWKQKDTTEESDASATASPADFWQQQQGDSWKERGQNIGKFWEDFYRSRFDPTYDSKKDLDY